MSLIDTRFQVDESKCVGCGLCQLACPSMLIEMNEHKKPSLKPVKSMDWYGCMGMSALPDRLSEWGHQCAW